MVGQLTVGHMFIVYQGNHTFQSERKPMGTRGGLKSNKIALRVGQHSTIMSVPHGPVPM